MRTKYPKLSHQEFHKQLSKAQKDPQFKKELREFVKATTTIYNLE